MKKITCNDKFRNWPHKILDFIWPQFCINCKKKLSSEETLFCRHCLTGLRKVESPYCRICGDPVNGEISISYKCQYCTSFKPDFTKARSVFRFRCAISKAIYALKYHKSTYIAAPLAEMAVASIKEHYNDIIFDLVTYVPLHNKKFRKRTYNQAAIIATHISKKIHVPLAGDLITRVRDTGTQTKLNFYERKKNMYQAFQTVNAKKLRHKTILLVDDVMTTGATVNACAKALKKGGALDVYVITIARG